MAREEDESPHYILPNHLLLQLAKAAPRSSSQLLAACPRGFKGAPTLSDARDASWKAIRWPPHDALPPSSTNRCPSLPVHLHYKLDALVAVLLAARDTAASAAAATAGGGTAETAAAATPLAAEAAPPLAAPGLARPATRGSPAAFPMHPSQPALPAAMGA